MDHLLTIAVLLPLAAAFAAFLFPADKPKAIRALAIFSTGVSLLITVTLFAHFDRTQSGYQFVHGINWLPSYGCSLKFGVDGISMTLLLLVGLVSFCGTLISSEIHEREKEYYILFLALTSGSSTSSTSWRLSRCIC
jgi:NADH:ubiquinone oxidoreductase subunit 4 (subunit M)